MYPLAYGFIASENTDNWTWFMEQLKKAIGDPPLLAVCSDACKGLENAVKNVFPQDRAKGMLLSYGQKLQEKI